MTPSIIDLFNRLTDGLAVIATDGAVRFANEGIRKLMPIVLGETFPHASIAASIDQAYAGHLNLPHRFETDFVFDHHVATPDRLEVHLVRSPAGNDLVVVVRNLTESSLYETTIANLSALIDNALAAPLVQFSEQLSDLVADTSEPTLGPIALLARRERLVLQGLDITRQLKALAGIAQLSAGRPILGEDRIILESWLDETLSRHDAKAKSRSQRLLLQSATGLLPTVYGSTYWLGMALDACIDNAICHSGHGTDIALSACGIGNYVRITLRNQGYGLQPALLRRRLANPLMRGKAASDERPGLGLGLPLARKVVELHGGRLVLEQELDGFVTCIVELPAGTSPLPSQDMNVAQAQRYANDLVRLLSDRNTAAAERASS